MAVTHLTLSNFDEVTGEGLSLVDFWAPWCGPCRMQAPILDELDAQMGDKVKICKVDVDQEPELAKRYGIMSIPSLLLIRDGNTVSTLVGLHSLEQLTQMLS